MIKMAQTVRGSEGELKKAPLMTVMLSPSSPLLWNRENVEMAALACKHGLPVLMKPLAIAGATAPVTLAAHLALANAETLAGITLVQLLGLHTPTYYGPRFTTMDMKTGITSKWIGRGTNDCADGRYADRKPLRNSN